MKVISAILALLVGVTQATYHPYYHGYNPFAALAALGLYNPHILPAPYSGTYSYHDGNRPTVVQANNDGYKFPQVINGLYPWSPWAAAAVAAAAPVVAPPHPVVPVPPAALVAAPAPAPVAAYHYYGHPGQPYHYSIPQKTVVQANLGGHDPWNYGAFYGTGIYGFKFNNYAPAAVPVLRIE